MSQLAVSPWRGQQLRLTREVLDLRNQEVVSAAGMSAAWLSKAEASERVSGRVARRVLEGINAAALARLDGEDPPTQDEARAGGGTPDAGKVTLGTSQKQGQAT